MALHPDAYEDKFIALEMLVYFRRQLPSYHKAETDLSGRNHGIGGRLAPSKKTGKATMLSDFNSACAFVCICETERQTQVSPRAGTDCPAKLGH